MQIKNFHLIRSVERNTLSELFLGRHVHDNYLVKIRLYDQSSITNEEVREAIIQRLRNSYQMRHRNIIATLDYGTEGKYIYQVQEHMDGGTLEDLLHKAGHIPPEISAFILQEILRGLQYAHNVGIFHGMLHPAKVLFSSNGIVKIDDFQFLDVKNTFLKHFQTRIKAKHQMYLAPEHLLGKDADHRCDLFSTGLISYKMLTGKHPFLEEQKEWTTMQIVACNPKPLFEMNPTLPPAVEEIVEQMIEKEVSSRVQSAEDALKTLDFYVGQLGDIRSYEVISNFLKKPHPSVEQLEHLRAEEFLQQSAQYQLHEQWDKALIALYRARFLRPKEKQIEEEIQTICNRLGYISHELKDPKAAQLEQTLKSNPENIQVLQRLATLTKSRGDLLRCVGYYKRILKLHPDDAFAQNQLRQLLENQDTVAAFSPAEAGWTRWQNFYRAKQSPFWQRWTLLQRNFSLLAAVFGFGVFIGILHFLRILPIATFANSGPLLLETKPPVVIENQKTDAICDLAISLHSQGKIQEALEILSKTPLPLKGEAAARARILQAQLWRDAGEDDRILPVLNALDVTSATLDQKIAIYKMKAEAYQKQGRYGHAIDQFINIQALPGISTAEKADAEEKIERLQNEAMLNHE